MFCLVECQCVGFFFFFKSGGRQVTRAMFDIVLLRIVKKNARSGLEIIISAAQKPYNG